MTEDEARNKWCPFAGGSLRMATIVEGCIASDCACWVADKYEFDSNGMRMPVSDSGHCGLIK